MDSLETLDNLLKLAYNQANSILATRGSDDPVGRAIECYTLPNLKHWIDGQQAGSIQHLKGLLDQEKNG